MSYMSCDNKNVSIQFIYNNNNNNNNNNMECRVVV